MASATSSGGRPWPSMKVNTNCILSCDNTDVGCRRYFATHRSAQGGTCPFNTLGLPKTSTSYVEVKARFLELAMKHHPDTANSDSNPEKKNINKFISIRSAFEAIVEGDDGDAILRHDYELYQNVVGGDDDSRPTRSMSDEEFDTWFHEQTGHKVPYNYDELANRHIDPAVLREVAELTEGMSQGGLDKGGMWAFAASLRQRAKSGDLPPLRVSEGQKERKDGKPARRRRRKR